MQLLSPQAYMRLLAFIFHVLIFSGIAQASNITFVLDMNNLPDGLTPQVNGTFNNWCGACNPMTDINGDNIWETTINIPNGTHEFKYTYNNGAIFEELPAQATCGTTGGQYVNRSLIVTGDATLPLVCWGLCESCTYDVTFSLDLTHSYGVFNPSVSGSFNNWCVNCALMTDENNDGIWTYTTAITGGNHEYKYTISNNGIYEILSVDTTCASPIYHNRMLTVSGDTTLPTDMWGCCGDCSDSLKAITFRLDMTTTWGFLTAEVTGSFSNWCGTCTPLNDDDGNGIWETTLMLLPGTYTYKYTVDNASAYEFITPNSPCSFFDGSIANRLLTVTEDEILPLNCWELCGSCPIVVPDAIDITSISPDQALPGETFDLTYALNSFDFPQGSTFELQMSDLAGGFDSPVTLAIATDPSTFEFNDVAIPYGLPGNCYRLRIVCSYLNTISNGEDEIKINSLGTELGNYALKFDGLNDYANLGPVIGDHDFTLSFWVKPDGDQNIGSIFDIQNDLIVYHNPLTVDNYVLAHLAQFDLLPDQWNHVSITINATTNERKIYLFGQLVAQTIYPYSPILNYQTKLGKSACGYCGGNFKGIIDEVKIWDSILPQATIWQQVQQSLNGSEEGLIAYYNFNEGCFPEIIDLSPNQNHGLLYNGTKHVVSDVPVWESNVVPSFGGNTNVVNVTVHDYFPLAITEAKLTHPQLGVITSTIINVEADRKSALISFDLTNTNEGVYTIELTESTGSTKIYPESFEIVEGIAPEVWVEIVGRNVWRDGRPYNFVVTYGNSGTVDAKGVPIWIVLEGDTLVDLQHNFTIIPPVSPNADAISASVPLYYKYNELNGSVGQFIVFPVYVPYISPGEIGALSFSVRNLTSDHLSVLAYSTLPHYQSPLNEGVADCVSDGLEEAVNPYSPNIPDGTEILMCLTEEYSNCTELTNYIVVDDTFGSFNWNLSSAIADCYALGGQLELISYEAPKQFVQSNTASNSTNTDEPSSSSCGDPLNPVGPVMLPTGPTSSFDPNEKVGPSQYQTLDETFNYAIYFENLETAGAAAQQVFIFDTLDVSSFDLSSFEFDGVGFGDIYRPNDAIDKSNLNMTIDLRPSKDLILLVQGNLNTDNGIATWQLISLDPSTMQLTEDPILGFLDPNDETGRGQGFVLYHVNPLPYLETGHQINNDATIIFDYNTPIATNTWGNTIDLVAPESAVNTLANVQFNADFEVQWSGADPVISSVMSYDIYVSENGGAFTPWLTNYSLNSAIYHGTNLSTYSFYSVAYDQAGNQELAPLIGDASTTVFLDYIAPAINIEVTHPSCSNSTDGSIQVTTIGGNEPLTIWWNGQEGANSLNNLSAGSYNLVIRNSISIIEIDTIISITNPLPIDFSYSTNNAICPDDFSGSATVMAIGGTGNYTFDWNGFSPAALNPGEYDFTITDANNCSTAGTVTIDGPSPFTFNLTIVNNTSLCNGEIILAPSGGTAPYSYQWTNYPNEVGNSLVQLCEGEYSCTVTDYNGCTYTTEMITVIAGINELSFSDFTNVIISPNPSSGKFNISFNSMGSELVQIRIFDMEGSIIYDQPNIKPVSGPNNFSIELAELASGFYTLELESRHHKVQQQIVISRD